MQMHLFEVRPVEPVFISKNCYLLLLKKGKIEDQAFQNLPFSRMSASHCCLDDSFRRSHHSSLLWLMTSAYNMSRTQEV